MYSKNEERLAALSDEPTDPLLLGEERPADADGIGRFGALEAPVGGGKPTDVVRRPLSCLAEPAAPGRETPPGLHHRDEQRLPVCALVVSRDQVSPRLPGFAMAKHLSFREGSAFRERA
jgi:hypothetical protein